MQIVVVGAGPGGLSLAILVKRADPSHHVTVLERDGPDETFGWGVALAQDASTILQEADPPALAAIRRRWVTWDRIDVVHRGERIEVRTEPFAGVSRTTLVTTLRQRAIELGVDIHFRQPVRDVRSLPDADLVVGADGAHSLVRHAYAQQFGSVLHLGTNKYIWLGLHHRLAALTVAFRRLPAGVFVAHAYPHDATASTVIIECNESTWLRARLDRRTDVDACGFLSDVFAQEFEGHLLVASGPLRWRSFLLVDNARWHAGPVALVGDALHTVHFSTGSGTRVAIEDAIALAGAALSHPRVDDALTAYETTRRLAFAPAMAQARASLAWFERADTLMTLTPIELAYRAVVETGRVAPDRLAGLDPEFVRRACSRTHP
jgi:anthraniloyl-CoA monooxygenase